MIINIVGGNGAMGRTHKEIFKKNGHTVIISGRNSNPSMIESAKQSDITIVSVPIDVVVSTIQIVAPYCKAIADFTSMKKASVDAMLNYASPECEVLGIHPLYGEVASIRERTVVLCKTPRSGTHSLALIECFKKEGAKLIEMDALEHDKKVSSTYQLLRIKMLSAFLVTIESEEKKFSNVYDLSPPPTKNILELLARQLDEKNDEMYSEMLRNDAFFQEVETKFIKNFTEVRKDYKIYAQHLRIFMGNEIESLRQKAKNKIE